ncbi:MAG: tRNA dihydrouridine synthase DusB [Planctomycetota bacterium]|jgi:nifR3 family TIM-barrel protein
MKIGDLRLDSPVLLAPMAGVTNQPFRVMARQHGCALTATEMLSADFLVRQDEKRREVHRVIPEERPMALQIMGHDPGVMAEAAGICEELGADVVDINMGCPVRKVVNRGGGAALMKNPERAAEIVRRMKDTVSIPVTAKLRAGWEDEELTAPSMARTLQDAGVAAVAVHGRSREQQYKGSVNRELIRAVKESVDVPVVANGDVLKPDQVGEMIRDTGADGVMIGRGAIGNLWIFRSAAAMLNGKDAPPPPTYEERLGLYRDHIQRLVSAHGDWKAVCLMRKYAPYYASGVAGARAFRAAINSADTPDAVLDLGRRLFRGERDGVRAADALGVSRDEVREIARIEKREAEEDLASRGGIQ